MQVKAIVILGLTALLSPVSRAFAVAPDAAERSPVSYYDDIKPVLAVHCYKCHDGEKPKGGLRLDTRTKALAGGKSGDPAIVPGISARSELVRRILLREGDEMMPPKGARLTETEVQRIQQWVDEGAKWPERDDYWAFQPPLEPPLPEGKALNPIDRFIHSRLSAAAIEHLPKADARTLLRRAFFDLLGVPPSPDEAQLFLRDETSDAYEKLIDRLLADPRYGERWARHWLDLVRYGESDGYEDDKVRPHAWRYRDYVIRSLNADKPYDRFVQEQIAGDELWPDDPEAWIATGFARLGPWDGMSKEPAQQRQDFLNDATDAVGAAFLGVTLGCARCHDHKYDVITQRDYYRVQAFFAGVKRETRETKGELKEPPFVTAVFKADIGELARLKSERDELLRLAREALEKEGNEQPGKKKVDEDAVKKRVEKEHPGQLGRLNDAILPLEARVRFHEPKVETVFHGDGPKRIHLLKGGELSRPGEEVTPGFIAAMLLPAESASLDGQRADLARWLTSPENSLTARVQVNRLWQHHFGQGLVATPSDFGRNGKRPTHPELLDWLARQFVRDGWSLKKMHRLMMTSAAYRRASSPDADAFVKDPENKLLWRMNRRRLEGEAIRDTILAVSGMLNPAIGGPGVYAQLPKGVNVEFPNNDKELSWGSVTEDDNRRRSIYLFQRRSLTFPLMDVFDGAPMNQSCAARPVTTVAPQALALFNGEFVREAAVHFANRLRREVGDDASKQMDLAFQLAFTRPPGKVERVTALKFLQDQTATRDANPNSALADFCHVLLNASELIYPD
jgi:hypothetical protein